MPVCLTFPLLIPGVSVLHLLFPGPLWAASARASPAPIPGSCPWWCFPLTISVLSSLSFALSPGSSKGGRLELGLALSKVLHCLESCRVRGPDVSMGSLLCLSWKPFSFSRTEPSRPAEHGVLGTGGRARASGLLEVRMSGVSPLPPPDPWTCDSWLWEKQRPVFRAYVVSCSTFPQPCKVWSHSWCCHCVPKRPFHFSVKPAV